MKKSYRCIIKGIKHLEKTDTGKVKVWRSDKIKTYCCELTSSYFIWERASKFNHYEPYSTYVREKNIVFI